MTLVVLASPAAAACRVPATLMGFSAGLPMMATALHLNRPVTIVALGSSSTYGTGASTPERTYPAQLQAALSQGLPGRAVAVINRGVNGDTATMMLERLQQDVVAEQPTLVIWQTGTNDVLRGVPLAEFLLTVRAGLARLRAAGADVVLMETQWLPTHEGDPTLAAYIDGLRTLARETGTPLFRRHALMTHLIEDQRVPAERLIGEDKLHMRDEAYACTAAVLADRILATLPQAAQRTAAR
ncbi:MAG: GDSL-type esterase/lipase family protein [Alphaproteobacteria bacterium]|nr:GDSL-type esterase/lipase family protein [Alphaproteobacteria bacterium]